MAGERRQRPYYIARDAQTVAIAWRRILYATGYMGHV